MDLEASVKDLYWRLQDNGWLISVGMGIESIIVYVDKAVKASDLGDIFTQWHNHPVIIKRIARPDWHIE